MRMRQLLIGLVLFLSTVGGLAQDKAEPQRSVFDIPRLITQQTRLQTRVQQLIRAGDHGTAAVNCRDAIRLFPEEPSNYYNLACCQALLGRKQEALKSLTTAVDKGFNNAAHIKSDKDLRSLRGDPKFAALVKRAPLVKRVPSPLLQRTTKPGAIDGREALVSDANTRWHPQLAVFQSAFDFDADKQARTDAVTKQRTKVAKQVHDWYVAGTAAGLKGHLYDNHDGDHSPMRHQYFPQLRLVKYDEQVKQRRLHSGLQLQFFYNAITIGNSSTAWTRGPYWRSQPRLAYTTPRNVALLYLQYTSNHLYVYPEHEDHDVKKGDVYACNTPYLLISQGSSGSDRVFLEAAAWALASFQPKAKERLAKRGALMPALQMVFRRSNKNVNSDEDYLSGKAHPTVFDGKTIDQARLVNLAHEIPADRVPPVVRLKASAEDQPKLGVDYFDDQANVKFFDTPAAICRLMKSTKQTYRMVVSAEESFDLNDRDLTFHWRVLRGDPKLVKIKPLNKSRTVVEITVSYQARRPIQGEDKMTSTRVDVGAFVHNGAYYSAPAFISFHSLRNEIRKYNEHGKIASVEYLPFLKQYADPFLHIPRAWTDEYHYDDKQRLTGWTRTRKKSNSVEEFTPQGAVVVKKDESGRALQARTVTYRHSTDPKQRPPILEQVAGNELLHYEYESDKDRVGRVAKRTPIAK